MTYEEIEIRESFKMVALTEYKAVSPCKHVCIRHASFRHTATP